MAKEEELPAVVVQSKQEPLATVIWLHGLGADGHDFEPVAEQLCDIFPLRIVLPHARRMPVTINGGMNMPAWYDMLNLESPDAVDWKTVEQSEAILSAYYAREQSLGFPAERIFWAGFSQGGAMALRMGLKGKERPAGILALSTYLLEPEDQPIPLDAGKEAPIFFAHGTQDPILPYALAERSVKRLRERGAEVDFQSYPMPHSLCQEELQAIAYWFKARLEAMINPSPNP